jgi:hypothetical protein
MGRGFSRMNTDDLTRVESWVEPVEIRTALFAIRC